MQHFGRDHFIDKAKTFTNALSVWSPNATPPPAPAQAQLNPGKYKKGKWLELRMKQ